MPKRGVLLTITNLFTSLYSACGDRGYPGTFQNKSVSVQVYSLLGQTEGGRKVFSGGGREMQDEVALKSMWMF